jgi:hypothetical protein
MSFLPIEFHRPLVQSTAREDGSCGVSVKNNKAIVILVLVLSSIAAESSFALPFVNDDYRAALKAAKQRHLPLFVDVWAPW